jgi:cold shock protein
LHLKVIAGRSVGMSVGKVKWFNDAKGYGFITHEDGRDVFVHYSSIEGDGFRSLNPGQDVEYEYVEGPKGLHASLVRAKAEAAARANARLA